MYLTKKVYNLYTENYKTPLEEIKDLTNEKSSCVHVSKDLILLRSK